MPAFNDNMPKALSQALSRAFDAMNGFELPNEPQRGDAARAFQGFRLPLNVQRVGLACTGRCMPAVLAAMEQATAQLVAAPCSDAADFAMKALAAGAATYWAAACAAGRQDPAAMIADAEQLAELMAGLAADALGLARGERS
jgi:hypothetical protein